MFIKNILKDNKNQVYIYIYLESHSIELILYSLNCFLYCKHTSACGFVINICIRNLRSSLNLRQNQNLLLSYKSQFHPIKKILILNLLPIYIIIPSKIHFPFNHISRLWAFISKQSSNIYYRKPQKFHIIFTRYSVLRINRENVI